MKKLFTETELEDLRAHHPLPDGVEDIIVNRDELSRALNCSVNTIDNYRKEGMPAQSAGGPGNPYEFQLHDCWAWYHGKKAHERSEREDRDGMLEQLRLELSGDSYDGEVRVLTPREQAEQYEAVKRYAETAILQGTLVRRSEVRLLLEGAFSMFRNALDSLPDTMEQRVGLEPHQADIMERVAREEIAAVYEAFMKSNLVVVQSPRLRSSRDAS